MSSVDVEDLLEADGSIFETPVPRVFLTVAQVVNPSCKWKYSSDLCINKPESHIMGFS